MLRCCHSIQAKTKELFERSFIALREWLTESGASFSCSETVTISFDTNRKASVESVKDKKTERE
jgi:hypothetical protein